MNSPFGRNPDADFRPRPISASKDTTEQDKLRVTRPVQADFRPRMVVDGPKESPSRPALMEEQRGNPAHPAVPREPSSETGKNTQPAESAPTPKSSSPNPPVIPSKPSASA